MACHPAVVVCIGFLIIVYKNNRTFHLILFQSQAKIRLLPI